MKTMNRKVTKLSENDINAIQNSNWANKSQDENPYPLATVEYHTWNEGYISGMKCRSAKNTKYKDFTKYSHNKPYANGFDTGYKSK